LYPLALPGGEFSFLFLQQLYSFFSSYIWKYKCFYPLSLPGGEFSFYFFNNYKVFFYIIFLITLQKQILLLEIIIFFLSTLYSLSY
jgi:hypothetical protein